MAELLKNRYSQTFLQDLAQRVKAAHPPFPADAFLQGVMDETWEGLELKARTRHITTNLGRLLPGEYGQALAILDKVVASYAAGFNDFTLMFFPDFVAVYGQDAGHWDLSMAALERYTPSSTAEFAVRPFIIRQQERMMAQMALWATHGNEHVRRLASEGCRPALPWGQGLPGFKKDPSPVLPILARLKADPSPYVRKSVANNLNDISKTHPDLVAELAAEWYGRNVHTDWVVKHGCRTLLKKGNRDVLALFGFGDAECLRTSGFALEASTLAIGENLTFSFSIKAEKPTRVRLEYSIAYVKAGGRQSQKVFQISELALPPHRERDYTKTHCFANTSTRKHYPGTHSITLLANGAPQGTLDFDVLPFE